MFRFSRLSGPCLADLFRSYNTERKVAPRSVKSLNLENDSQHERSSSVIIGLRGMDVLRLILVKSLYRRGSSCFCPDLKTFIQKRMSIISMEYPSSCQIFGNQYYEKTKQRKQQPRLQHHQTESAKVRNRVWFRTGPNSKINQSGTTSEYFDPLQTYNTGHTLTHFA